MRSWRSLFSLLHKKNDQYRVLSIPKRDGTRRVIHDPSPALRVAQLRLLSVLSAIPIPEYIHGFERGRSVITAAQRHVGKDFVISLDIKDFFPSIKSKFLYSMFLDLLGRSPEQNEGAAAGAAKDSVAWAMTELCTYKFYVPQGAITSPKISSIVSAKTFGPELERYCTEQGLTLTIYADDVTISGMFPEGVTLSSAKKAFERAIVAKVSETIQAAGFRVNVRKTKVMRRSTRQWVCGAVVNDHVNMQRKERLELRAIVFNTERHGIDAEASKSQSEGPAFVRRIAGRLNWACQLCPDGPMADLRNRFSKVSKAYMHLHNLKDADIPELAWKSSVEEL